MIQKVKLFLRESKEEFKRVNWPSTQETLKLTYIVIGVTLFLAAFLGLLDFSFAAVLSRLLNY